MYRPALDSYDAAALAAAVVLFVFGWVVYPRQIVQVIVIFVIFTISVGWMAYFLRKWWFAGDV